MRKVTATLILLGLTALTSFAQNPRYIMLDSLEAKYTVHKYTLRSDSLYGTSHEIELFNVELAHKKSVTLFAVLPDFYDGTSWDEIKLVDIPTERIIPSGQYHQIVNLPTGQEHIIGAPRWDIKLIKKQGDKYYVSERCLTEYFILQNFGSEFNSPRYVMNIGQTPLSIRDMKDVFEKSFPGTKYIMTSYFEENFPNLMKPDGGYEYIRRYLSDTFTLHGQEAYQFWTYAPWNGSGGHNDHRGIDRFVYVPGMGIVGGSFDFYFKYTFPWKSGKSAPQKSNTLTKEQWIGNILDEKIMLAEELK